MADLDRSFIIPEAARKRAQETFNATKSATFTDIAESLRMMGDDLPNLTDKQREALLEKYGDGHKLLRDRVESRRAKGLDYSKAQKSLERALMADEISDEFHRKGAFKDYDPNNNVRPKDVFEDKNPRKTIGSIQETLKAQKEAAEQLRNTPAERAKKLGMKIVKSTAPKVAAAMGGPIGWGIAGASMLMDANDAYAAMQAVEERNQERVPTPEEIERTRRTVEALRDRRFP